MPGLNTSRSGAAGSLPLLWPSSQTAATAPTYRGRTELQVRRAPLSGSALLTVKGELISLVSKVPLFIFFGTAPGRTMVYIRWYDLLILKMHA